MDPGIVQKNIGKTAKVPGTKTVKSTFSELHYIQKNNTNFKGAVKGIRDYLPKIW